MITRLFAIAVAIYSINRFVYSVALYLSSDSFSYLNLGYSASILLISIFVWFMPYSFISLLTGHKGKIENDKTVASSEDITSIVFGSLALYLLYKVISDISYWVYFYLFIENQGYYENQLSVDQKASIFATAIEAIFIVILISGNRKIFELIRWLRK